jgi:16S rRNA processing protein RimM
VRLELGRVGRPHGLHGEVQIAPTTNVPDRFAAGGHLYLDDDEYVIETSRPHQGRWLVRFAGVDDRDAAERLRGRTVRGDALAEPPEGELWVHELIGAHVRDRSGASLGTVVAVEANPAHDLLVLDGGGLIPVVFVVGREPGVVVVDPPPGLLEL